MTLGNLFKKLKLKKVLKFGFIFFGVNVLIFCLAFYRNESQRFMPYEYKLVQKIFNKMSLNNDLGDRPISLSIRAGDYMHIDDVWILVGFSNIFVAFGCFGSIR